MSINNHLTAIKDHLRKQLDKRVCPTIEFYAGEFDEEEIKQHSYRVPAIFISCLGWRQSQSKEFSSKTHNDARIAIFITTKNKTSRIARMQSAIAITEEVQMLLQDKRVGEDCESTGKAHIFNAENLYSRKLDKQGQALFLLSYWQAASKTQAVVELVDLHGIEFITGENNG